VNVAVNKMIMRDLREDEMITLVVMNIFFLCVVGSEAFGFCNSW